ncbi:MAG: FkbM family methyltransferase [Aeoliella sp.]
MIGVKGMRYWMKGMLSWVVVPVLSGPLKGCWFGLFTGSRFIRGTYGENEAATFQRLLKAGDVVLDIGAHVGYFTLLAARLVGSSGKVFAFEPLPLNLAYLNRHVLANRLTNVEVLPVAVGRNAGQLSFDSAGGTGRGRLGDDGRTGELQVEVVSLDDMHDQGRLPGPNLIKMDVEGVEVEALHGASRLLAQYRPNILLSVHGEAAKRESETFLRQLGYHLSYFKQSTIIAVPSAGNG